MVHVGHLGGGHLLFRCSACGAFWEQALRGNAPIAETEARRLCPSAFVRLERTTPSVYILAFSTSNYDAMIKFLRDFRFTVIESPYDQLTPFFEPMRGARIIRGDLEFQLEESQSAAARACFNLWLTDYPDEEIEKIKALGYECDYESFAHLHIFRTPDGGTLVL